MVPQAIRSREQVSLGGWTVTTDTYHNAQAQPSHTIFVWATHAHTHTHTLSLLISPSSFWWSVQATPCNVSSKLHCSLLHTKIYILHLPPTTYWSHFCIVLQQQVPSLCLLQYICKLNTCGWVFPLLTLRTRVRAVLTMMRMLMMMTPPSPSPSWQQRLCVYPSI